ncbi:MAG: hypothetical protein ACKOXT_04605 [Actinomycetota bacterium]
MSDQPTFLSRRERREAEKLLQGEQASNQSQATPKQLDEIPTPDIFLEPVKSTDFASTTNFGAEPVTASIIINTLPELENQEIVISAPGGKVITGSIELPSVDPTTGSITIITHGAEVDEAINEDSLNSFVSSVAPIRAAGIAKTRSRTVELNLVTRRGQGQVYAVMSTAVLMMTIGALVIASYMLGLFD